jgi:hypothetical protein
MNKKKYAIALVLLLAVVASVSAASYGNRISQNGSSRSSLSLADRNENRVGRGNGNMLAQTSLEDGEESAFNNRMGSSMNKNHRFQSELPETCLVTGEAPVAGSRLGFNQDSEGQGLNQRWTR